MQYTLSRWINWSPISLGNGSKTPGAIHVINDAYNTAGLRENGLPSAEHWRRAAASLQLTDQQYKAIMDMRAKWRASRERARQQAADLPHTVQAYILEQPGLGPLGITHQQLEDCHLRLRRCQKEERDAICRFNYEIRAQVLTPMQNAKLLILSFPYKIDMEAIFTALAEPELWPVETSPQGGFYQPSARTTADMGHHLAAATPLDINRHLTASSALLRSSRESEAPTLEPPSTPDPPRQIVDSKFGTPSAPRAYMGGSGWSWASQYPEQFARLRSEQLGGAAMQQGNADAQQTDTGRQHSDRADWLDARYASRSGVAHPSAASSGPFGFPSHGPSSHMHLAQPLDHSAIGLPLSSIPLSSAVSRASSLNELQPRGATE
ncbi:hypothetical protein WJX73_003552 [Symbiochloris irregularis]|uniref:Uncharacterized protein n=1 Tax=Symbiochloris irregularis TaxID=706552 RepID=A0AAW1NWZ9_9CHLO